MESLDLFSRGGGGGKNCILNSVKASFNLVFCDSSLHQALPESMLESANLGVSYVRWLRV